MGEETTIIEELFEKLTIVDKEKEKRVSILRSKILEKEIDHNILIMKEENLKNAHLYCIINDIQSQKYGLLLENYICNKYGFEKINSRIGKGDCKKDEKTYEIKVSLGGKTFNKFNYVQIRFDHLCDYYLLLAYHVDMTNIDEEGELYIFRLSSIELKGLIIKYGGYAHGTIKELGKISETTIEEKKNIEYAIRPLYNSKCWEELLKFRINEDEL